MNGRHREAPTTLPEAPFVGLRPYERDDQSVFFGRGRDAQFLSDKIFSARLTLLYARSGLGKSSLLRALVIPALEAGNATVVYFDAWSGEEPAAALKAELASAAAEAGVADAGAGAPTLSELVRLLYHAAERTVVLILDQFEEFLSVHGNHLDPVKTELAKLIKAPGLDARVVISMREEYLAALEPFRYEFIHLFESTYRLGSLDPDGIRAAIEKPIEKFGGSCSPEFVTLLVDDLMPKKRSRPKGQASDHAGAGVELPMLQLICRRLWDELAQSGDRKFTTALYQSHGKADGILDAYVKSVVPKQRANQRIAAEALQFLAPPSGLKMSYSAADLEEHTGIDAERLTAELKRLEKCRILRSREYRSGERYELLHDAFIKILRPWAQRIRSRKKRIRFLSWGAGVLTVAVIVAVVGGVALIKDQAADSTNEALAAIHQDRARTALLAGNNLGALKDLTESCKLKCGDDARVLRMLIPYAYAGLGTPIPDRGEEFRVSRLVIDQDGLWLVHGSSDKQLIRAGFTGREHLDEGHFDFGKYFFLDLGDEGCTFLPQTFSAGHVLGHCNEEFGSDVRAWNIRIKKEIWPKKSRRAPIKRGSVNRAGTRALTFSDKGAVVWNMETGAMLLDIPSPEGGILDAVLSPDGGWVATLAYGDIAELWDVASEERADTLRHKNPLRSAVFSDDERFVATTDQGGVTKVWSTNNLDEPRHEVKGFFPIVFAPNGEGPRLAVAGNSEATKAWIWDLDKNELVATLHGHQKQIATIAFDASGTRALTGSKDGTAKIWNTKTGDLLVDIEVPGEVEIKDARFLNDQLILTLDDKERIMAWRASKGPLLWSRTAEKGIEMAVFSPDGKWIGTTELGSYSRIWDAETGEKLHDLIDEQDENARHDYLIRFSPDGQYVVTAGGNATARIWDATSGRLAHSISHDENSEVSVAVVEYGPSGRVLLTASDDPDDFTVELWDTKIDRLPTKLEGHQDFVVSAAFMPPKGQLVATASWDGTAKLWDTSSGELKTTFNDPDKDANHRLLSIRFDANGTRLLGAGDDGIVRVWETQTGALISRMEGHQGIVSFADFDNDGENVITAGEDETLKIWDVTSCQLRNVTPCQPKWNLTEHYGSVNLALFSPVPDSPIVISASQDGTVKVWAKEEGELLAVLEHRDPVKSAGFDPNWRRVVSAAGKVLSVWDLHPEEREADEVRECLELVSQTRERDDCTHRPRELDRR